MKLRDFFKRPEPTGREPVKDRNPATREELAALGRQVATSRPAQVMRARRRPLFVAQGNPEDGTGV